MPQSVRLTHYYSKHVIQYLDRQLPGHGLSEPDSRLGLRGYTCALQDFSRLLQQAELVSKDPLFGLSVAVRSLPPGHGILGLVLQACGTLAEACLLGHQLQRLSRSGMLSQLTVTADTVEATFDSQAMPVEQVAAFIEYCMGNYFSIANTLAGSQSFKAMSVQFRHGPRASLKHYQQLLNAEEILFAQAEDKIVVRRSWLEQPLPGSDGREKQLLLSQARKRLVEIDHGNAVSDQLLRVLREHDLNLPQARCAEELNLSVSTLKRRLQQENTSFQRLQEQARLIRAQQLLTDSELSIEQVGKLSGFSNASAFSRAFRRYFQLTPQQFRLSQLPE